MALGNRRFIMGNMPPPIGGVSTFMRRYVAGLERAGVVFSVRDWVKMKTWERAFWFAQMVADPRRLDLEVNAYETWAMIALIIRPFRANILLRVHSGRPETRLSPARKWIFRRFLRTVTEFVLVGPHVRGVLAEGGFQVPADAQIEPAFLPPPPEDEPGILSTYNESLIQFVERRHPLLVIQGSDTFYNGVDLYGSDLATQAMLDLREDFPGIGLLIGRPTLGDERFRTYCAQLAEHVRAENADHHVAILDGEREFWPIVKRASIFLRPTALDGDSIGVREAMHFGVPVVASDVVPRPDGVHLFKSRDQASLTAAIRSALARGNPSSSSSTSLEASCS